MTIRRDELEQDTIDFSDVSTSKRIPAIHPGEILRTEFLEPMKLSVYALSKSLNVSRSRLNDIVLGRRAISADTALRLGRYFRMSPEFWINLQSGFDLATIREASGPKIEREVDPRAA